MKTILLLGLVFFGVVGEMSAQDSVLELEKTPLPLGDLIAKAPDLSKWQIDFTYARNSAKPAGGAADAAGEPANITSLELPRLVTVTRTKPRYQAVLVSTSGTRQESFYDGNNRYEIGADPSKVVPIASYSPGYKLAFLDYTRTDFPDVEWVSAKTYLGTQKGTSLWVFRDGKDGATVWVDSQTRYPVRWQKEAEIRTFKFLPPPSGQLPLPEEVSRISKELQLIKQLSSQVPPHR